MKKIQTEVDASREERKKKQKAASDKRFKDLCIADHINDDAWMVAEGLRAPNRQPRDPEVWTKTAEERARIKELNKQKHRVSRGSMSTRTYIPCYAKLIIQVRGCAKTTYSTMCWQADVPRIVGNFKGEGKEVLNYKYNGKQYAPNEVPFWE